MGGFLSLLWGLGIAEEGYKAAPQAGLSFTQKIGLVL